MTTIKVMENRTMVYDPYDLETYLESYEGANDGKFVYNKAQDCDEIDLYEMGWVVSDKCPIHGVLFEQGDDSGFVFCPKCRDSD